MIDEAGKMVGIVPTQEALELARTRGLDLIEVAPHAQPPVVKILSYDKYRYQLEKAEADARRKQKKIEVKGIRISMRIGEHDLKFKALQAKKFLEKSNKVKIEMFLRGRERANVDFAFGVLKKFLGAIPAPYVVEQEPKKLGNLITVVIAAK